jgi:hypothetical protein
MAAFPKRTGFGTRLIARRAGVDKDSVARYVDNLVELGLVNIVGEEKVGNFPKKRPIYSLPLQELERISNEIALDTLLKWEDEGPTAASEPENQLPLNLPLPDADEQKFHVPTSGHGHVPTSGHEHVPTSGHGHVPTSGHEHVPTSGHGHVPTSGQSMSQHPDIGKEGRNLGRKDGAPAQQRNRTGRTGRPPTVPPPPPAEAFTLHPAWIATGSLPKHPRELWRAACPDARPIDNEQLAALAAEHDEPTGDHGWYWVGRAVLLAAINEDVRSIGKLKAILTRWRTEDSYGSDPARPTAKEIGSERPPRERPARPVAAPRREQQGPPPGLKMVRDWRNGTPPGSDGGEPT